ncbi:DUF5667 domain-containing protein [Bacillus sp. FJAT-45350]|uniref:DUF5667 domain-containing protein n=1 Tax=Bacillus sp. FJAT-45350 TaxID=2011014 RepID=UPI000BB6D17F|nr:DUF5667 domain-containing protein [Bacillus sp. FJAT-45350]
MSNNKMLFSKNVRNVLATSVITTSLAFTSVAGQAYANNHELEADLHIEATTDGSVDYESINVELEELIGSGDENSNGDDGLQETPKLLPGDLLYFTKTVLENVKLALTFDDVKEIEIMITFTQERIKEAAALLENGEEELANIVLQRAIEQQELALAKYENIEDVVTEEEAGKEEVTEEEVNEEEVTEEDANVDEVT